MSDASGTRNGPQGGPARSIPDARGPARSIPDARGPARSIGQALRDIVPRFAPTESVRVPLLSARGRVLTDEVIAGLPLPGFDHSAMDGYAVRFHDLPSDPSHSLPVRGESRAGGELPAALAHGHAMRIFTGAPLPDGADTVVIQEDVSRLDDADGAARILVRETPAQGSNIRRRGSDLAQGKRALPQGQLVGPGEIALLAALNCAEVSVHRKPRVAILCTGDELRELGAALTVGTLINSNAYMLVAQVEDAGCEALLMPRAPDRIDALTESLELALGSADAVLTSGGVSVGDHDLVAEALTRADVTTHFWKVSMKPGKPLLFGSRLEGARQVPVLGLPGNPVSAFVAFEVFARPALAAMQGHATPYPRLLEVVLDHDHHKSKGRPELVRGQLTRDAQGTLRAHLHARRGSGSIPSIAGVDALVLLPAEQTVVAAGTALAALLIGAHPELAEPGFA